jgi:hypothetical protein
MQQKQKRRRKSAWDLSRDQIEEAERRLRESKRILGEPEQVLKRLRAGETIKVPLCSDLFLGYSAFELLRQADSGQSPIRPDADVLHNLLRFCHRRTALPDCRGTQRFANALVALSAHHRDWVRPLEDWEPDTHNANRQFRSLLRHLIATYDVPSFMDAAWFEGLTPGGVRQQGWYKLIGRGRNRSRSRRSRHTTSSTPSTTSKSAPHSAGRRSSTWAATSGWSGRSWPPGPGRPSSRRSSGPR